MPTPSPTPKPQKFNYFNGHRKPSYNQPTVRGGVFSNRLTFPTTTTSSKPKTRHQSQPFNLANWHPDHPQALHHKPTSSSSLSFLSPIARFIVDAFQKNQNKWDSSVVVELQKLRRVTPSLVAEVLKVQNDPLLATKFFHWAGKQKGYKHDFACYNAYIYCLNRTNQFRSADQVPELMVAQGKPPSEKQFEILFSMHADKSRGLRVYYVYEKMKKFGIKPRVFLYNRIIDALFKTGHLNLALSVYEDFRDVGLVESKITFMVLIKGLCKFDQIEKMLQLLARMRENLCKPDVFAYTAMVKVLVLEGNLDGCLKVWNEMRRDLVVPDVMAYGTVITGLCKGGRVAKGYELFKEMKEKGHLIDREIYGALVDGLVEDQKLGLACDLLKDLVDSGYRADLNIYSSLIRGLCKVKRLDKAYKLFQMIIHEGLKPDFLIVNPILVSYAELGRIDDFFDILGKMQELGYSIIHELEKFFSSVVGKEDEVEMAIEVFEKLKVKGYYSVAIYNILIEALYKHGKTMKALYLFSEMNDLNVQPDSFTYSVAITCYVEDGDVKGACECFNKIIEMLCVPSVAAYCSLARGLCKIGAIDAVMMLVRDCLASVNNGPMEFKYSLTILHACKSCNADKVIEVLNEMMQQGCPPNEVIYSAIISGMSKHGTIEEARKIFSNLREHKLLTEARMIEYDEVLIEHTKKKTADLVMSGLKFLGLESKLKAKGCILLSI